MSVTAEATGSGESLLSTYLLSDRPGCIVLIGSQKTDIHWADAAEMPPVHTFSALSDYSSEGIVAPAVAILQLTGSGESLNQVLGGAARMFPDRLLVCLHSSVSSDNTFFALGFRRLNVLNPAAKTSEARWYEYRLSSYKPSPDWLNAQFWANPNRFDVDEELDIYTDDEDEEE